MMKGGQQNSCKTLIKGCIRPYISYTPIKVLQLLHTFSVYGSICGDDFIVSVFHTAWVIYTLTAMVAGLAIALLYICLVIYTDWVISIILALL